MWSPEYVIKGGDAPMYIDALRINECPVSFITADTKELLNQILHARTMHRACGASLFGPYLSEWPAWAVEAMTTVENEHVAVENMLIEQQRMRGRPEQD